MAENPTLWSLPEEFGSNCQTNCPSVSQGGWGSLSAGPTDAPLSEFNVHAVCGHTISSHAQVPTYEHINSVWLHTSASSRHTLNLWADSLMHLLIHAYTHTHTVIYFLCNSVLCTRPQQEVQCFCLWDCESEQRHKLSYQFTWSMRPLLLCVWLQFPWCLRRRGSGRLRLRTRGVSWRTTSVHCSTWRWGARADTLNPFVPEPERCFTVKIQVWLPFYSVDPGAAAAAAAE